jgi:hypothetical protein
VQAAWEAAALPDAVLKPETMLSVAERRLLFWLGADYARADGAIVDAGCFVGGSTVALAEGLRVNPRAGDAYVDAFDRFTVDEFMATAYLAGHGLRAGDSFRPVFDANTAAVRDLVAVHEGDLADADWDERPIDVLFVDIAKTWEVNDDVIRRFFGWLEPNRSIVVQQDMAHALCPWLAITMELLADHFELLGYVEHNSVVYRCRAPIPPGAVPHSLRALPDDRKLALLERAIGRFEGVPNALLSCARALLLSELGEADAAGRELARVRASHPGDPVVQWEVNEVAAVLDAAQPATPS